MKATTLIVIFALICGIFCQQQCYSDNFSQFCGYTDGDTVTVIPNVMTVSGEEMYYVNEVNSTYYCTYWGLSTCYVQDIPYFTAGLGADSTQITQTYNLENSNNDVSFNFQLYQATSYPGTNITIYNGQTILSTFTVPLPSECTAATNVSYPPAGQNTPITRIVITGSFYVITNFSVCIGSSSSSSNNCGTPQLFTGADECNSLTNQCTVCTEKSGSTFYYTANCTSVDNTCHCQSYLYSQAGCQGDVFPSELAPSDCDYLSNFYPTANSVCLPFLQAPYQVNLYTGTSQKTCTPLNQSQCVSCTEFGVQYWFSVQCSNSQDPPCVVNQYSDSDCKGTTTLSAAIHADCDQLSSLYGTSSVCAFGYN